jgi:hypothetical protein
MLSGHKEDNTDPVSLEIQFVHVKDCLALIHKVVQIGVFITEANDDHAGFLLIVFVNPLQRKNPESDVLT